MHAKNHSPKSLKIYYLNRFLTGENKFDVPFLIQNIFTLTILVSTTWNDA